MRRNYIQTRPNFGFNYSKFIPHEAHANQPFVFFWHVIRVVGIVYRQYFPLLPVAVAHGECVNTTK